MAALHSALKSLSPCDFSDVPSAPNELESYISDLFSQSQLILESVPIPPPDESSTRNRSSTINSVASNASEISSSSERSAPPAPELAALQKEWGKPVKLSAKENPLNIAVYKLGGKDGHGAWFARRSVHEGLGFARFKHALEQEFPESMAVQGAPGEGNVRGIGAEKRVVDITVEGRGRVEVVHLTAQFPGPTTPRDFVTFLVTSSKAIKSPHDPKIPQIDPRHYMIISKPCNHPETPPFDNFIRGQYESVEFIREVPRQSRKAASPADGGSISLEKEAVMRNAHHRVATFPLHQDNRSADDVSNRTQHHSAAAGAASRDSSPSGRKRGVTVSASEMRRGDHGDPDHDEHDSETNPVEWIMITRSDPGGSVPRFMVERGTPSSIVADASKFFDWACKKEEPVKVKERPLAKSNAQHQDETQGRNDNGHAVELHAPDEANATDNTSTRDGTAEVPPPMPPRPGSVHSGQEAMPQNSLLASASEMLSSTFGAYTPKAVRGYLPGQTPRPPASPAMPAPVIEKSDIAEPLEAADDAASTFSSTSFASAESKIGDDEDDNPSISSDSIPGKDNTTNPKRLSHHDKELLKLAEHRKALDTKLATARDKLAKDTEFQTAKEQETLRKAEEKHERELKKHEEKYKREVAKVEQRREKEAKKAEEKKRKLLEKDEKVKLTHERDEARAAIQVLKRESEIWKKEVGELQKENTKLMQKLGTLEAAAAATTRLSDDEKAHGRVRGKTGESMGSEGSTLVSQLELETENNGTTAKQIG